MIKKINVFLVLLLLFISISAVSAADGNITDLSSNEATSDAIAVSIDEDISYSSDDILTVDDSSSQLSASTHTITEKNYNKYFNSKDGSLVSTNVKSGDTIKLDGSFSGKSFVFNQTINVVGTSSNNMKNSMVILMKGASGSSISSLKITNNKEETYGIFLNSASNCIIKNCIIKNTGKSSYCICLGNNANYNKVTNNDLTTYGVTYGHNQRSTPPLVLSGCHYNTISKNKLKLDDANGIYLSTYPGGPLSGGDSNHNVISENTITYNVLPTSWSWGIQVMGSYNSIQSNTISGAYRGVSTAGYYNNITYNTIKGLTGADYNDPNVEIGGEYGIVASYNSIVTNNNITGAKIISTGAGISAADNSIIEDNYVDVASKGRGVVAGGSNIRINNNNISTELGSGVYQTGEVSDLVVTNNRITSVSGVCILIEKVSSKRMPKNVKISKNILSTGNKYAIDAAGAQVGTCDIDSSSNVIMGGGLINSPAGVIDTSKPTYIYKGTTHIITPKNIRDYINDNGGLTSEINDGDILEFKGTFKNEVIYVTKGVKITGNNPKFLNSTFKVTSGNVLIENLVITNNKAERVNAWGIYVNQASGVRIINNKISVNDSKASYAIYALESSYVDVLNNDLTSEGDYLTFTLLSYACEDCTFANNTVHTIGTGDTYNFKPERCLDGNEVCIDGAFYCLDGNELFINGTSYKLVDGKVTVGGVEYCVDGNEVCIDGKTYCLDGSEVIINGQSVCLDGNEVFIDGNKFCLDGSEVCIDGKTYSLVNGKVTVGGVEYCVDGNEVCIDGQTYCFDGNEVTVDGQTYCFDGNEYKTTGSHVVSEIYQTYGILLLYSSNNIISGNDVDVTSKLVNQQPTTGDRASTNSIVGIDIYFNCHNNTVSDNNVIVSGKDNYIYGMGVLGYYTGHSAPDGQGATNNSFIGNKITLEGPYCVEGIIVGDESEDTFIEDNVIDLKSDAGAYGIYFELSQKSTVKNNDLTLNSKVIYGIEGYGASSDNVILGNTVNANGNYVYGVLFQNGKNNNILNNRINANGNGKTISVRILDSIGVGNAGIYLIANSTNNYISNNEVNSNKGYAIALDENAINNIIIDNYLDSEKGIGNKAVNNSKKNTVSENYKYIASATSNRINVAYLGTGEFIIKFDTKLNGALVKFYDADNKYFAQSTVAKGIASAKYVFDGSYIPALYKFKAQLSKENYKSSTFGLDANVVKGNIMLDMKTVSIEQGSSGKITATVLNEAGNPIKGVSVEFYRVGSYRNTLIGTAVSDSKGVATITYKAALSLDPGSYSILSQVRSVENYNDAKVSSTLNVTKKLSISGAKAYSVYYGNTISYKVRILGADGKAVGAGEIVKFKINGVTKSIKTSKNGYASYSVKLKAGTYTMTVQAGNHKVSKKITFKPTLIAKNLSKKKAKTTKFTVKLVSKKGKILKSKKITFKFNGKKYSAKTNKKGVATLSLKNLKVGKYTITSSYGGCTIKNTLKIKK